VKIRVSHLALALAAALVATAIDAREPVFETVAPGVTAVLQPEGFEVDDANALVIATSRGVVVVDAPADREIVEKTLEKIAAQSEHPVRYVVNTHWHTDHTQSNHLYRARFGEAMTIVGHKSLTHDVPERASAMIHEERERLIEIVPKAEAQLAKGLSLGGEELDEAGRARQRAAIDEARTKADAYTDLVILAPDLTYEKEMTLHLGGTEIRLLHFGAHTEGDTVVYLPQHKVLATGDLLDIMPFAGHGFPSQWVETLEAIEDLDFDTIVPGHGPVYRGKAQLLMLRDYFQTIVDGVEAAVAAAKSVDETVEAIDLSHFRKALAGDDAKLQRNFDHFAPEAVRRAYALATDAPSK